MSTSLYRFLFAAALTVALGIALLFSGPSAQAQTSAGAAAEDAGPAGRATVDVVDAILSPSTDMSHDDTPDDGDAM